MLDVRAYGRRRRRSRGACAVTSCVCVRVSALGSAGAIGRVYRTNRRRVVRCAFSGRAREMRTRVCVWCARRASAAGVGGGRCEVTREGSRRRDVECLVGRTRGRSDMST